VSFPATYHTLLERIRSSDAATRTRARDALAAVYWAPIYAYVRLTYRVQAADAEDLTQGFFAEALRRELFARYEPGRARFRTYIRRCVDSFVANALEAERRLKRGGGAAMLSLEAAEIESRLTNEIAGTMFDADAVFHAEWVRAVILAALTKLQSRYATDGRALHLRLFQSYDLADAAGEERATYAELARRFDIPATQVTNWLATARRDFRSAVLETLRELSASDAELRDDVRSFLGIDIS
jgi:RNA polymerase sigma factor (sigma-70 family)